MNFGELNNPKTKIIILPGLGASWNSDAIVYNKSVGVDQWKMTPFVANYNGLVNGLKQNGLKENNDFYVWNYDWRKPLNEIVGPSSEPSGVWLYTTSIITSMLFS